MFAAERAGAVAGSEAARTESLDLYARIRSANAKLMRVEGTTEALPSSLPSFLSQLLGELEAGKPVTILQSDAVLTTIKAAKALGVSRQFLVQLLERDQIRFHMVGTHRRVYARDVLAFKAKRDSARRKTLDDLARAEMGEGVYDRIPLPNVAH